MHGARMEAEVRSFVSAQAACDGGWEVRPRHSEGQWGPECGLTAWDGDGGTVLSPPGAANPADPGLEPSVTSPAVGVACAQNTPGPL